MTPKQVKSGFTQSINHPFTGKNSTDAEFAASLSPYQKQLYNQAVRSRANILKAFSTLGGPSAEPPMSPYAEAIIRGSK